MTMDAYTEKYGVKALSGSGDSETLRAMKEASRIAEANGISDMSLDEINAEIAEARNGPNAETIAALNEYCEMKAHPEKYRRYSSFREAMEEVSAEDRPNRETISAMLEAERIARDPSVKRYSDVEKALRELKE